MRRIESRLALGGACVLLLAAFVALPALPALCDQSDGKYDLPDHALAAGDRVGTKLFDRRSHVVLQPRHVEKVRPEVEPPRNELPAWPAKWAPDPEEEYE